MAVEKEVEINHKKCMAVVKDIKIEILESS